MLAHAIQYATTAHKGQMRKHLNIPFIEHPMQVMRLVIQDIVYGGKTKPATIAILHDVVEDCTGDSDEDRAILFNQIKTLFGKKVCEGVAELTNVFTKGRYPQLNRAQRKGHEVQRLTQISERGKVIKLYDRLVNLTDAINSNTPKFTPQYASESWNLVMALINSNNEHVAEQVISLINTIRGQQ
jgi:(p)ppGpp synthase/HD superfamily hydrolase